MRNTDAAWLAGIFDGEGSINLAFKQYAGSSKKGAWVLRIRITNTHEETIRHVVSLVGGHVAVREYPEPNRQPSYNWQVEALTARDVMLELMPYLVTKREQVALGLEAEHIRRTAPRMPRPIGTGRGAVSISAETHAELERIAEEIRARNTHRLLDASEMPHRVIERAHERAVEMNRLAQSMRIARWSFQHECCVVCGTTERPHRARGECSRCYATTVAREYRAKQEAAGIRVTHVFCSHCQKEVSRSTANRHLRERARAG